MAEDTDRTTRRIARRRVLLAVIAALVLLFEGWYWGECLRFLIAPDTVPTVPVVVDGFEGTVVKLTPAAERAGVRLGDELRAVDGIPYTGRSVLGRAVYRSRPGAPLTLTLARPP